MPDSTLPLSEYGARSEIADPYPGSREGLRGAAARIGRLVFFVKQPASYPLLAPTAARRRTERPWPVRPAPARVARRRGDRVPPRAWRHDPRAAVERLRRRRRCTSCRRRRLRDAPVLRLRHSRLGEEVAERGRSGSRATGVRLVLASTSPRAGRSSSSCRSRSSRWPPSYVENDPLGVEPADVVRAHAEGKAALGSRRRCGHARVDTGVVPTGALRQAGGRERRCGRCWASFPAGSHRALRALPSRAWIRGRHEARTEVRFRKLSADDIAPVRRERRVAVDVPAGTRSRTRCRLVERIEGDYLTSSGSPARC